MGYLGIYILYRSLCKEIAKEQSQTTQYKCSVLHGNFSDVVPSFDTRFNFGLAIIHGDIQNLEKYKLERPLNMPLIFDAFVMGAFLVFKSK